MTAVKALPCRCAHSKAMHDQTGYAGMCSVPRCPCTEYRPNGASPTAPAPGAQQAPRPTLVRPPTPAQPPTPPAPVSSAPTIEQLISAAARSEVKATVRIGARVVELVDDLRGRLADEREAAEERRKAEQEKAAARAEVERLERELAAAKAKLTGRAAAGSGKPRSNATCNHNRDHACEHDGCDRTFPTCQGLTLHRRRAHEGLNPRAGAAR